eukprot:4887522-Pyramimonas_sp.AAC.3
MQGTHTFQLKSAVCWSELLEHRTREAKLVRLPRQLGLSRAARAIMVVRRGGRRQRLLPASASSSAPWPIPPPQPEYATAHTNTRF